MPGASIVPDDQAQAGDLNYEQMFAMIMEDYQQRVESGEFTPERKTKLDGILRELGGIIASEPQDLAGKMAKLGATQVLMTRMVEALSQPTGLKPPEAGSRAAQLYQYYNDIHSLLYSKIASMPPEGEERQALFNLYSRCTDVRNTISGLADDVAARRLEAESLRQFAMNVREYCLVPHLTLVNPKWASPPKARNPNAVFIAAGSRLTSLLEQVGAIMGLDLLGPGMQRDPVQERWDQLRECNLAVFDLTGWKRDLPLEEMAPYAAVTYELGIAFALGCAVLIFADQGQSLPFDIDIEPLRLSGDADDAGRLMEALDGVLYGVQRVSGEGALEKTLKYIEQQYADHTDARIRILAQAVLEGEHPNPQRVSDQLTALRSIIGLEAPLAIYPAWPGDYPSLHERRGFHITAFREWTEHTTRLVQAACRAAGVSYIRGDQVLTPDIIRSIWDEICQAAYIVTDLTGLNPNATLELGMAHALGRNVFLISQDRKLGSHFRAIGKERVHYYSLVEPDGAQDMLSGLERFLSN